MVSSWHEEQAALHALGLLDEAQARELLSAAKLDPELEFLVRDYERAASALVYSLTPHQPPPEIKAELFRQIPSRRGLPTWKNLVAWLPYFACLIFALLNLFLFTQWLSLSSKIKALESSPTNATHEASSVVITPVEPLQVLDLDAAKDSTYTGHIILAWQPTSGAMTILAKRVLALPKGQNYVIWALLEAGPSIHLRTINGPGQQQLKFSTATPIKGFAVSLETNDDVPTPTLPYAYRGLLIK